MVVVVALLMTIIDDDDWMLVRIDSGTFWNIGSGIHGRLGERQSPIYEYLRRAYYSSLQ